MNKLLIGLLIVGVLVVALGTVGFAYAQTSTPGTPVPGQGSGPGMMGGRGARGGRMGANAAGAQEGYLHDEMVAAFAEKLGIPASELDARFEKGETMAQIAYSKGLTADQFQTLAVGARSQAVDQAVKSGKLTQQQADWMKQRGPGLGGGFGRGGRGNGQCGFANPNCPYATPTAP